MATIERLARPVSASDMRSLAELLVDAVDSGAAVSFLGTLDVERAEAWWTQAIAGADSRAIILLARDSKGIVGTVQCHPSWAPNQPHRADIAKLIVHRRGRHAGLGQALMQSIEEDAKQAGFTLLTLDAKRGGAAERLYRRLGWTEVGVIPNYAVDTDGVTFHDTVIFYKDLLSSQPAMSQTFKGLGTVIYAVPDLERAKQWYATAFQQQPYFDQPFYVGFNIAGYELGLDPNGSATGSGRGGSIAYWRVEHVQQVVDRFVANGATVVSPLADVGDGIQVAIVADPFDNLIGLIHNPHFKLPAA